MDSSPESVILAEAYYRQKAEIEALKAKYAQLIDGGQKLEGILANIRHETDYLPDFYYT